MVCIVSVGREREREKESETKRQNERESETRKMKTLTGSYYDPKFKKTRNLKDLRARR